MCKKTAHSFFKIIIIKLNDMKILNYILIFGMLLNLTSCMVVGSVIGGKKTTFEKTYVVKTNLNEAENNKKLKDILYTNGWNKLSETEGNSIVFYKENSVIKEIVFSKKDYKKIIATISDNVIELEIIQHGNFKNGTLNKTNKTFELIKREFEY